MQAHASGSASSTCREPSCENTRFVDRRRSTCTGNSCRHSPASSMAARARPMRSLAQPHDGGCGAPPNRPSRHPPLTARRLVRERHARQCARQLQQATPLPIDARAPRDRGTAEIATGCARRPEPETPVPPGSSPTRRRARAEQTPCDDPCTLPPESRGERSIPHRPQVRQRRLRPGEPRVQDLRRRIVDEHSRHPTVALHPLALACVDLNQLATPQPVQTRRVRRRSRTQRRRPQSSPPQPAPRRPQRDRRSALLTECSAARDGG